MSKITIYSEACNKVDGFRSMGEEFIRKLVINGKSRSTLFISIEKYTRISIQKYTTFFK